MTQRTISPVSRVGATPVLNNVGGATLAVLPNYEPGDFFLGIVHEGAAETVTAFPGFTLANRTTLGAGLAVEIWYKVAVAGEVAPTVLFASGAQPNTVLIRAYGAVDTVNPFDSLTIAGVATTNPAIAIGGPDQLAITPTVVEASEETLAIAILGSAPGVGITCTMNTFTGGFTEVLDYCTTAGAKSNKQGAIAEIARVPNGGTTLNTTAAITVVTGWYAALVVLRGVLPVPGLVVRGIPYATVDVEEEVDIYFPTRNFDAWGEHKPVLLHFAGGGANPSRSLGQYVMARAALDMGIAVVSCGVRLLTGTTTWKEILADAKCVVRFMRATGNRYSLNQGTDAKIGVEGHSFGAQAPTYLGATPGVASMTDLTLGYPTEYECINAGLSCSGEAHPAYMDARFAFQGVARAPQLPVCTLNSPESQSIGSPAAPVLVCALPRWDGAAPDPSPTNDYNPFAAQFWYATGNYRDIAPLFGVVGQSDTIMSPLEWIDRPAGAPTLPLGFRQVCEKVPGMICHATQLPLTTHTSGSNPDWAPASILPTGKNAVVLQGVMGWLVSHLMLTPMSFVAAPEGGQTGIWL